MWWSFYNLGSGSYDATDLFNSIAVVMGWYACFFLTAISDLVYLIDQIIIQCFLATFFNLVRLFSRLKFLKQWIINYRYQASFVSSVFLFVNNLYNVANLLTVSKARFIFLRFKGSCLLLLYLLIIFNVIPFDYTSSCGIIYLLYFIPLDISMLFFTGFPDY